MRGFAIVVALGASGCSLIDALGGNSSPTPTDGSGGDGPATDGWQARAPLDGARAAFGVAVISNKIYVYGGISTGVNFSGVIDEYDPVANEWTRKATSPTARVFGGGSNAVSADKAYFVGGTVNAAEQCSDITESYNPALDHWETLAPLPTGLCGITVLALGPRLFAIGGNTEGGQVFMEVPKFDIASNTWSTTGSVFPSTRSGASGVELGGRLYLIGGAVSPFATDIYNPVSDAWSRGENLPTPRAALAAAATGDKIYVAGGIDELGMASDRVHIYDPGNDEWSEGPRLPQARSSLGLAVVGDTLYAIGGNDGGGPIANVDALKIMP